MIETNENIAINPVQRPNNTIQELLKSPNWHPENAPKLREMVLQLAVQGKLSQQWRANHPNIASGQTLLNKIKEEKASIAAELQSAGTSKRKKKEKELPPIAPDEPPFEIPENWVWSRFGDISEILNGRAYKKNELLDIGKYVVLRVGNLFTRNHYYYSDLELDETKYCEKEDLLYAWSASFGPHIWKGEKTIYHYHIWKLDYSKYMNRDFIYHYLKNDTVRIKSQGNGIAMMHMTKEKMERICFPLPPLAEQKEIVKQVDALMAEINLLEQQGKERIQIKNAFVASSLQHISSAPKAEAQNHWQLLKEHFSTTITDVANVKKLRETILQLAVQGQLTRSWRLDHRTLQEVELNRLEELRKNYQKEDSKTKGKKTFKYRESVEIDIGGKSKGIDSLFKISEKWKWTSLGQITWSISDGPHFSPKYTDSGIPIVSGRNITFEKGLDFTSAKLVTKKDYEEFIKRGKPEIGDVLLTKGGTTGIPCVVETSAEFSVWVHVALLKLIREFIDPYYLRMTLASPFVYRQSQEQTHGIGNKDLGLTRMVYFAIPLPPLEEQKEIVRVVDELMGYCDDLEEQITSLHKTTQDLVAVGVREAVN